MKKRLIVKEDIKKAYSQEIKELEIDLNIEPPEENIDKLPKEMFEILGEVVSFIENINRFEGDKNEDK